MSETDWKLNNDLREAIIKTIVFFDLFEYPLTVYEIWNNLGRRVKLLEIKDILDQETAAPPTICQKNGFYFLFSREEIIITRQKRHNYSVRKIKIARRFTRLFSLCPFVKVIALANSIGQFNLRDGSDIDFFIITAPRRIWLSRLYCTGLAKILNSRPAINNKKDKICLSFYVSEDHLNLADLRLVGFDPYFDYWRPNLVLLYNKAKVYQRFLAANEPASLPIKRRKPDRNFFLDILEVGAKKLQLKIMPVALKIAINNSDGVVISDEVLKLYQVDRRREYAQKYGFKINEIFKESN